MRSASPPARSCRRSRSRSRPTPPPAPRPTTRRSACRATSSTCSTACPPRACTATRRSARYADQGGVDGPDARRCSGPFKHIIMNAPPRIGRTLLRPLPAFAAVTALLEQVHVLRLAPAGPRRPGLHGQEPGRLDGLQRRRRRARVRGQRLDRRPARPAAGRRADRPLQVLGPAPPRRPQAHHLGTPLPAPADRPPDDRRRARPARRIRGAAGSGSAAPTRPAPTSRRPRCTRR